MKPATSEPLGLLTDEERALLRASPVPADAAPMEAVLTRERFSDPDWIFERKLDGIRCIAIASAERVRLLSRNNLSMNQRYPELASALLGQPAAAFAIDGEVVAFDGTRTSFARLAQRKQHRVPVFLHVFDIVWLDGYDVRALALRKRKTLLRAALQFRDPVRWTEYRNRDGERLFIEACRKGWEGLRSPSARPAPIAPHGRATG